MFAYTKLMQAMAAAGVVSATDPYFNLTTLLLPGNGTNGAQNNTFLDSSTNAFSITRNGNTTQGTFTPFSQTGWGIYNTTGQYCQLNNSDYAISTGDFTIEFWMYCTDDSGSRAFAGLPSAGVLTISMTSGSSGARQPYLEFGGGGTLFTAFSNYLNKWTHVAFVRSSGTVTVYQNGTSLSSASKSAAFPNCANLSLARLPTDTSQDFIGYFSNYRICKSAVYTSNFTPSTTPLTTTSQGATSCQLLTFQNNRFLDNSSNASTVTPTNTSIQAFSPFAPTAAYSTSVVGGSGYFDGSGDYLTAASNAAFAFGTGDFEVDFWFYPTVSAQDNYDKYFETGASVGNFVIDQQSTANQITVNDNNSILVSSSSNLTPFAWNYVTVSRASGTLRIFLNGTQVGSVANSTNFTQAGAFIGSNSSGTQNVTGYFSGVRVVKGSGVSSVTVPTAPLTAITNTQLLLNFTNGGIIDATAKNDLETVGNAQISTTQSKWGGSSMYFDGTGDYLPIPSGYNLGFGTGDFTIEGWLYLNATSSYSTIISNRPNGSDTTTGRWSVAVRSSAFEFYANGSQIVSAGTVSTSSWTHFAVCRASGSIRLFLNGTQVGSTTSFTTDLSSLATWVGANGAGTEAINAYIDDLRVTKYARYTANFTAPTEAFALQ